MGSKVTQKSFRLRAPGSGTECVMLHMTIEGPVPEEGVVKITAVQVVSIRKMLRRRKQELTVAIFLRHTLAQAFHQGFAAKRHTWATMNPGLRWFCALF